MWQLRMVLKFLQINDEEHKVKRNLYNTEQHKMWKLWKTAVNPFLNSRFSEKCDQSKIVMHYFLGNFDLGTFFSNFIYMRIFFEKLILGIYILQIFQIEMKYKWLIKSTIFV